LNHAVKTALASLLLLLALCPAVAQTKSITIGKFQYVGTGVTPDGLVESNYQLDLDATGITVDPVAFRNVIVVVKGTRQGTYPSFPIITTGPGCGNPPYQTPCSLIFTGAKGFPLATCATYNSVTQQFTQNCISGAVQFVSLTGKHFSFALVDGEQFCTYGITNIFLDAKPGQRELNPHCGADGFCAGESVPVVLHAAPSTSCN